MGFFRYIESNWFWLLFAVLSFFFLVRAVFFLYKNEMISISTYYFALFTSALKGILIPSLIWLFIVGPIGAYQEYETEKYWAEKEKAEKEERESSLINEYDDYEDCQDCDKEIEWESWDYSSPGTHRVNGYYRDNGTYVEGYERSNPDGNPFNNLNQ